MFFTSYRTGDAPDCSKISLETGETAPADARRADPSVLRRPCIPMAQALVVTRRRRAAICGRIDRATLAERRIFACLARSSASARSAPMASGSPPRFAGQACGAPKRGLIVSALRRNGAANIDSVSAHRDPSAVPPARARMDRVLRRSGSAHAPRAPRRHRAASACTSTATTSSSSTRPFSARPAIWYSPSGRTRFA